MATTVNLVRRTAIVLTLAAGAVVLAAGPASAVATDRDYDGHVDVVIVDTDSDGKFDSL
jgi:hypothetical protein